ncbi:hypothetical protein NNQ27_01060 [Cronobacter dublinensis subsp. infanticibi]|uniref:hypothetical protein n=1 Tax=Cronobacter dublinensis TaxID=413497 RepID=UPI0023DCF718|nr:hypothetical protein [Cronobacter dublinensis]WEP45552.1 hypothetical protein NNQ27_01060 [Cronobacter dublinensis]
MKKINKSYASMIWQSLAEDPNMNNNVLGLNLSDKKSLNSILLGLIKTSYDRLAPFIKERCKNSFAYAINFYDEKKLLRIYESAMPVFDPPSDMSMKQFYITVWETLFPGENYQIKNSDEYIEVDFKQLYDK